MSFSMASLLIHSQDVPAAARRSLVAASVTAPEERDQHLASAARILYAEVGLDCADARELVGLPDADECACG